MAQDVPVKLTLYRWAGQWGPFKVNIPCGECSLTVDVIKDTMATELDGIPVDLDIREWLNEWWRPLPKGGWHAPIVMVEGKLVSQGHALNRGVLTEAIIAAHVERSEIRGNHVFGKETCPHCVRAKGYLEAAGVDYAYHDVVRNPRALYEDDRQGQADRRAEDTDHRAADLDRRRLCRRRGRAEQDPRHGDRAQS